MTPSIRIALALALCVLASRPTHARFDEADHPGASVAQQEEIGLVYLTTDVGTCVGTLLNRYWVLTSDNCVIVFKSGWAGWAPLPGRPGRPLAQIKITAAWNGKTATPTRRVRYWNSDALNVALLFLGKGDFGPRDRKIRLIHHDAVDTSVLLTKFSNGDTKKFTPDVANETTIELSNLRYQAAGSAGAPDYLTAGNEALLGIAGVTSECHLGRCVSTPLFALRDDILERIKEKPREIDKVSNTPGSDPSDVLPNHDVGILTNQPNDRASAPSVNCKSGYVWRVARPDDLVCVTPAARSLAARENAEGSDHSGPIGTNACASGFVWRNAFDGDGVCVTPSARDRVAVENRRGPSRMAGH